jgi:hypothetical protein
MADNESYEKIVKWLGKEKFALTPQEKVKCEFCLKVETTVGQIIPFYVSPLSDSPDKIVVYWGWQLMDQYIESLRATNDETKRALYRDLQAASFLTNTNMKFNPDIQMINLKDELKDVNLQEVKAMKNI